MCFPGHILNDLFTVFLLPFLKNLIKSVMKKKNFTFLFKLCKKVEEECIEKRRKQKLFSGGWGGGGETFSSLDVGAPNRGFVEIDSLLSTTLTDEQSTSLS